MRLGRTSRKLFFIWTNQSIRSVDMSSGPEEVEKLARSPLRMGFGRPDAFHVFRPFILASRLK